MDLSAISSTQPVSSVPTEPALRAAHTPAEQRKAVAGQFEAILLRQFLNDSMGSMLGGEDTPAGNVYGYLLTDVMANKLSQGGGMGLSNIIVQQLTPRGEPATAAPPKGTL